MRYLGFVLPVLAVASPLRPGSINHEDAPIISSVDAKVIPDHYVVVFKDHVKAQDADDHHSWLQNVHTEAHTGRLELRKRSGEPEDIRTFAGLKHTYSIGGMLGYAGHFDEDTIDQVRKHKDVAYVEQDFEVHTLGDVDPAPQVETNAPWGLARISHRDSLSFSTFDKYLYAETGGEGVDVYVVDTGTNIDHVDFEGRAKWGKTVPAGDEDVDGNGHGTHCSGTVGGKRFGVAKKANIYAVKVLRSNGSGTMSDVVKGVEFVAQQHVKKVAEAKKGKHPGFKGSTANMSLGGGKSAALDLAVNAAVDAGVHFAVAAGNDNADACRYSPAAAEKAITVGATALSDERSYFSNWGKCTDIFAPGSNIHSTWIGSKYATNKISGTSMASPHIAGLLAYYLSLQPGSDSSFAVADITPKKLKSQIISVGTVDAISDIPSGTPNILAWNGGGSSNYSGIVNKGSYTVEKVEKEVSAKKPETEKVLKPVSEGKQQLLDLSAEVMEQVEKLSDTIAEAVLERLSETFQVRHE